MLVCSDIAKTRLSVSKVQYVQVQTVGLSCSRGGFGNPGLEKNERRRLAYGRGCLIGFFGVFKRTTLRNSVERLLLNPSITVLWQIDSLTGNSCRNLSPDGVPPRSLLNMHRRVRGVVAIINQVQATCKPSFFICHYVLIYNNTAVCQALILLVLLFLPFEDVSSSLLASPYHLQKAKTTLTFGITNVKKNNIW